MKVIRPITLTDAMLVSSTVAEPSGSDPATWSSGTTYAKGDQVRLASTHLIYQSLQDANTNHNPATATDWWGVVCAVNKWAMFDTSSSSASTCASPLTVVFDPGLIDALVLIGMTGGTLQVSITDGPSGPTIYSRTVDLLVPVVNDWYAYYFEPFRQLPIAAFTDIPPYYSPRVTVTITGDADVACAVCVPGRSYTLGMTLRGVNAGIHDYSRKVTDEATGLITLQQRKFAKTLTASLQAGSETFGEVSDQLERMRATPAIWIADDRGDLAPLTVYGFYRDFRLVADYPGTGHYELEIEGMV